MNKVERSVGTAAALMAYGPSLVDVDLEDDEELAVSSDNLPDCYRTLRTSAQRTRSNAIGPYFTRAEVAEFMPNAWAALKDTIGEENETIWLQPCRSRLPMGDLNAVDFASIVHCNALLKRGIIRKEDMLGIRTPIPPGKFSAE